MYAGDVDLGMIPIENSVAGRVADIHHLMPTSGLHIIAEWFLPIRNQLMAPKGASLKTIKTVQSHVMALGQCRNIIRELKLKPVVAADTAGSAREVAEAKDITRAAIASRLASEIYGLDILKENVEDESHSTTRFVVLSREKKWAQPGKGKVVTTFVFRVRNVPAALYKALGGFATNGVNMTKLESYMVGGNFFATQFYADVEGHPDDRALVFALEELAFFSKELTVLGVYPAHPFRETFKEEKEISRLAPRQTATRPRNPSMPRCSRRLLRPRPSPTLRAPVSAALRVSPTAVVTSSRTADHSWRQRGARHIVRDFVGRAVLLLQRKRHGRGVAVDFRMRSVLRRIASAAVPVDFAQPRSARRSARSPSLSAPRVILPPMRRRQNRGPPRRHAPPRSLH